MVRYVAFLVALIAFPAFAHAPSIGPNGGKRVDAGSYHVELVTKGREVVLYVSDAEFKPVTIEGYSATAILLVNGKAERIALKPSSGDKMTGTAATDIPASFKGAVHLKPASGAMVQGKFE